ncbi:putative phage tail protein [Anaerotruncus rubiinfantis]|uniref:putative phage tail protein n=1 Tax=Anaerotruncus rubiinfantis TaxID=1720200 RepID=UPI00189A40DF|nr:putative phage tail protein [Anaerotruncus rubiinfantis]
MFYDDPSDYLGLLPDNWRELLEVQAIGNSVNIQMDKLLAAIKQGIQNKSVSLADEQGVVRWENILGVTSPLNSSLQARREALRAKIMAKPPINLQSFKAVVEAYMGLEVDVELAPNYTIKVWYRGESRQPDLAPLYATVYEMIPANLIVEIMYRYVVWNELDALNMNFDALDAKNLTWDEFEKGEWIE